MTDKKSRRVGEDAVFAESHISRQTASWDMGHPRV